MATIIYIYWNDLTRKKRAEILDTFGDNCNFDAFPIAVEIEGEPKEKEKTNGQL